MADSDTQVTPQAGEVVRPSGEERSRRSALFLVFLVVFIDLLGFGIVLPLLPLYATELLTPLIPGDADGPRMVRGMVLGLLMASFSAMQFFFSPMWGRVSDRVGRRPILLLGLAGSVVFYTLFGFASEIGVSGAQTGRHDWIVLGLVLLFVARLGAGVAGATIATAQAVIADCTPPDRRARGMALIGAAFGIGFTFGPLLGFASLFVESAGAPGYAAAVLSAAALGIGLARLPETRPANAPPTRRGRFDLESWRLALRSPTVGGLILIFFLATFAFGSLESTLALVNKLLLRGFVERHEEVTREALKTTERVNFLVFAYVGFVLMLIQGFVYRRFVQRVGEVRFLRAGVVLLGLSMAGAVGVLLVRPDGPAPTGLLIVALADITLAVIGFAFLTPSVQALVSNRSDPARQGEILGVNQSAAALARILGPFLGVSLFFVLPSHVLPYVVGALMLGGVLVLSLRVQSE